jgi:hypothetical protein
MLINEQNVNVICVHSTLEVLLIMYSLRNAVSHSFVREQDLNFCLCRPGLHLFEKFNPSKHGTKMNVCVKTVIGSSSLRVPVLNATIDV